MEKKIWTMPQVGVQEFAPNVCASSCGYKLDGSCLADDYYWWRNTGTATAEQGTVNFTGWGNEDDVSGFSVIPGIWTDEEDNYVHHSSNCNVTTGEDRYWTKNVVGLNKTDYEASLAGKTTGLNWVFGVAAQVSSGIGGIIGGIFGYNWHVFSGTVGEAVDRS